MGNAISERGLRLIATLKALSDLTDSEHGVSAGKLRDDVAQKTSEYVGHPIGRPDKRTTWRDVETLKIAGYAVERGPGTRGKYSLSSNFEPWELRFLADATRTSRSLTANQGNRIIEKLKAMAPIAGRDKLSRRLQVQQLYLSNTFKQTAYALEQIELALNKGWKISYEQMELDANGREAVRRDKRTGGKVRIVDPIEYVYSIDGYYYLIIYDPTTKSQTKTPRIDRMRYVTALEGQRAARIPREEKSRILEMYRRSFGMFEAESPVDVELELPARHAKSIRDKFGSGTKFLQTAPGRCRTTVTANLSSVFYSWIAQFGGDVAIKGPQEAVDGMREFLNKNLAAYRG